MSERRARTARPPGRPRSRHFLRQPVAAELVRDACVRPDDLVLDLGAGSGRLTAELASAGARVVAVELAPDLAGRLHGRWARVNAVCADAATVELPDEPFRVVANLPFSRTTAILRHLFDDPRVPLERADLIVEWGVAVKRALPWPSTFNDVVWGAWYSTGLVRRLPASAFEPRPRVDAGVLVVTRRERPLVPVRRAADYRRFVARGFRRGGRRGSLPRDLDAHEWATLFLRRSSRTRSSGAKARS